MFGQEEGDPTGPTGPLTTSDVLLRPPAPVLVLYNLMVRTTEFVHVDCDVQRTRVQDTAIVFGCAHPLSKFDRRRSLMGNAIESSIIFIQGINSGNTF